VEELSRDWSATVSMVTKESLLHGTFLPAQSNIKIINMCSKLDIYSGWIKATQRRA
jgi:hypothetical protein